MSESGECKWIYQAAHISIKTDNESVSQSWAQQQWCQNENRWYSDKDHLWCQKAKATRTNFIVVSCQDLYARLGTQWPRGCNHLGTRGQYGSNFTPNQILYFSFLFTYSTPCFYKTTAAAKPKWSYTESGHIESKNLFNYNTLCHACFAFKIT